MRKMSAIERLEHVVSKWNKVGRVDYFMSGRKRRDISTSPLRFRTKKPEII
jgi:hypothetical protein